MAFYCPDGAMAQQLEGAIAVLEADGRPGLGSQLSITWLRYEQSLIDSASRVSELARFWAEAPAGTAWQGDRTRDPAGAWCSSCSDDSCLQVGSRRVVHWL